MLMMRHTSIVLLVLFAGYCLCADVLTLDGTKRELRFDGIGGLSGGGATSRFLVDYEEPYRSQILDYLFLPNFGASLQILKVEIGGDCQSTEGTEASHMHSKDDLNYQRGYEWWLMQEAKKRNPDITLYSLTWCVPGWIGNGNISNFYNQDNIDYHIKWLQGAKSVYNLTVDYMGIWNERGWEANWVVSLRGALDKNGFQNVKLVCADNGWDCYDESKKNAALKNSVAVFGAHYPGTHSIPGSTDLGKPLWASEDYSSYSDSTGGGCWGRTLNHNWVNGWMTATIAWNLISAYYNEVPYGGDGLMWAPAPWNGYYGVQSTIWVSAHTTQFTKKGDWYLTHGSGSGTLANGGSYLTLVPDNNKNGDFTLVIETFTYENSLCIRSNEAPFTVKPQSVTFQIGDALSRTKTLYVWRTQLNQNQQNSYFEQVMKITPGTNGQFSLNLGLDQVWTISTLTGQKKGTYAAPPKYSVFPNSHQDDFESYKLYSEAKYFTDQAGSFEIQQFTTNGKANKVMRQMARQPTVHWCDESEGPISVVGKYSSGDVTVQCDLLIETSTGTANIGARVLYTGCGNGYNAGYFFGISGDGSWKLYGGGKTYQSGKVNYNVNQWGTAQLSISDGNVCAHWNGAQLACVKDSSMFAGFASIGSGWNFAQFDNFKLSTGAGKKCPYNGVGVTLDVCDDSTGNQRWTLGSDGTLRLANSSSCLGVGKNVPGENSYNAAAVVGCNPNDKNQQWKRSALQFQNVGTGKCLDVYHSNSAPCGYIGLYECGTARQEHMWGFDDGQITNIYITPGIFCITSVN